jgi:hypothetical protein
MGVEMEGEKVAQPLDLGLKAVYTLQHIQVWFTIGRRKT